MDHNIGWRPSFSVMGLLVLSSLVCLYLGLRQYIFRGLPYSSIAISVAIALIICAFSRGDTPLERARSLRRCISYSVLGAALVGAVLGIEIAEYLRRTYGYWEWWEDWPTLAIWIGVDAAIGGGTAIAVRSVYVSRRMTRSE